MMSGHSVLLITSNLGSVFEKADIEEAWVTELEKTIVRLDPSVVAIHCQEIGGKDWETTMPKVADFISKLQGLSCFSQFSRVRGFVDTNYKNLEEFTALGNLYLIHDSVSALSIWNFQTKQFQEVTGKEVYCGQLQECQCMHKERFPNHYFPLVKWSRKGFLLTKWQFQNGVVINFSNIHLFHDEDNLVALKQSPSPYTQHRKQALHHALDKIRSLRVSHSMDNHQEEEPLFIYGDFNFRLDLSAVIKHMVSSDQEPAVTLGPKGNVTEMVYNNSQTTDNDGIVHIRAKEFVYRGTQFTELHQELKPFDKELSDFECLFEEPVCFQPSYPFSETFVEGKCYMDKRCPGWCDRILMNCSAQKIVEQSTHSKQYNIIAKDTCVGDHKPVYLFFTLQSNVTRSTTPQD